MADINFSIGSGLFWDPASGLAIGLAYSGAPGFVGDVTKTSVKGKGPIPVGRYAIGAPVDDPVTGHFSLPLTPDPSNEMFDRGDFLIHGPNAAKDVNGAQASSEGCPVAALPVRQEIAKYQFVNVEA